MSSKALFRFVWLYGIIIFFSFHFVRDLLQDFGYTTFISTIFVKTHSPNFPAWYFKVFNGYIFAGIEIALSLKLIKERKFGFPGFVTIFLAGIYVGSWIIYWLRF